MGKEIRPVTMGTAIPVQDEPDWSMEPSVVTPVRSSVVPWEFATQVKPPAANDFQEKFAKAVAPVRAVALVILWVTWHWTRVAGVMVIAALVAVLVHVT